ncbi:MAG: ATP-binding protein [Bacteroidota bacterium]
MIKRFSIQIIIRVLLLLASCLVLAYFYSSDYWFSLAGLMILIAIQVYTLNDYVNDTNHSLSKFLDALKSEDYSVYFSPSSKGSSFTELYRDFNTIISIYKKNKVEKDAQHKHFQQILEYIRLGVISINQEDLEEEQSIHEILFFNTAAGEILGQPKHKYWHRLERQVPWFGREIRNLKEGGKKLLDLEMGGERKQLSLNVIKVRFMEKSNLIISFQDINSEIEQKEIEAWHNVIRVLAHEMMNSFTPVSSLASTIKSMTENGNGKLIPMDHIDEEAIRDINRAASTINKRSDGLMEFVNDYRTISQVPVPKIEAVNVKEFLEGIYFLMKPSLKEHSISLIPAKVPPRATLYIDEKMIEQVLINLIGNSVHALSHKADRCIKFSYELKPGQSILTIEDNGKGIPDEILKQVFIPFFTTRKDGSGIGLSLSKTIMRQHKGHLLINSEEGQYTQISLVFNNPDFV